MHNERASPSGSVLGDSSRSSVRPAVRTRRVSARRATAANSRAPPHRISGGLEGQRPRAAASGRRLKSETYTFDCDLCVLTTTRDSATVRGLSLWTISATLQFLHLTLVLLCSACAYASRAHAMSVHCSPRRVRTTWALPRCGVGRLCGDDPAFCGRLGWVWRVRPCPSLLLALALRSERVSSGAPRRVLHPRLDYRLALRHFGSHCSLYFP